MTLPGAWLCIGRHVTDWCRRWPRKFPPLLGGERDIIETRPR
jgi:hypothetical protein